MQNRDYGWLTDIIVAARHVREFAAPLSSAGELQADPLRHSAVVHQLLIIGEATTRVSDEFKQAHPEIPWKLMRGMRNILIHEYRRVDVEEVWSTASESIPELIQLLEPLLPLAGEEPDTTE